MAEIRSRVNPFHQIRNSSIVISDHSLSIYRPKDLSIIDFMGLSFEKEIVKSLFENYVIFVLCSLSFIANCMAI